MPIDPAGSVTSAATTDQTAASVTGAPTTGQTTGAAQNSAMLGKDDFLKLLIGQMKNQDPLNPTDGAEYMAQMTQFSILEQITNLGQTMQAATANDYDQHAINLVGRDITYMRMVGSELRMFSGRVESVVFTSHGPRLKVTGERDDVLPVSVTNVWGPGTAPPPGEVETPEEPRDETPREGDDTTSRSAAV